MTKLKKLLLTLAPISAVMIATPIILTSCSTNAEQNNGGSQGGGSGSGGNTDGGGSSGGNGSGGENTPQNPALESDTTNSNDFKVGDKGLFKTIETTIKAGRKGQESQQIDSAIKTYNNSNTTETDIQEAINVWSFNKWFGVKNNNVKFTSRIDTIEAKKNTTAKATTWDISFVYKFKVVSTIDSKKEDIYAEKTFDVKAIDLTAKNGVVDFTTNKSKFMVDGKDMLKNSTTLYDAKDNTTESESIKKVKEFLDAKTSNFNIRTLANDFFVKNKGIVGEVTTPIPVWQGSEKDKAAVVSEDKQTMTVTLPNAWNGNIKKGATHAQIKDQLKTQSSKDFILTYVKDGTGWTVAFDDGKLDATAKTSTFKMTLSKQGETNVDLTLIFKDVTQ